MFNLVNLPEPLVGESSQAISDPQVPSITPYLVDDPTLAAFITRTASKHTYFTIRFLVDHDLVLDAYRAYAYFRWLDDILDQTSWAKPERMDFLERQKNLLERCYHGELPADLSPEENMLASLIRSSPERGSGLERYMRHMMAVMTFDAGRRGRLVSQLELSQYSIDLATAVTEALHYFIGHNDPSPQTPSRYLAVIGAHITHMLRDTFEDVDVGYFNIPCEFLQARKLDPCDIHNPLYRDWVKSRVQLAQDHFSSGKAYLDQVPNRRCRIAGYAYMARFEAVLKKIENDDYQLRPEYPEHKLLSTGIRTTTTLLSLILKNIMRGQL